MPAAHMRLKYCLAVASLSGVNRLGNVLTGGPVLFMKHTTPWRDVLEASVASVISGKSRMRRVNRDGTCTTLTPETELEADEKRVDVLECINRRLHRSIVILYVWRKSNPRIGLET